MGLGSRRRSTSGSSCCSGTSPPFSASPWPQVANNSPLRRTGSNNFNPQSAATTVAGGSLAPIMGSPTRVVHTGASAWAHPTRAMTLPELACGGHHSPSVTICSSSGVHRSQTEAAFGISPGNKSPCLSGSNWSLQRKSSFEQQLFGIGAYGFGTSPPPMEGPIVFLAPELTQETLMEVSLLSGLCYQMISHYAMSSCFLIWVRRMSRTLDARFQNKFYCVVSAEGAQRHVGQIKLRAGTSRMHCWGGSQSCFTSSCCPKRIDP